AFDLGHHPADVAGVPLLDGGQRETTVATDDRRDAVHIGGRGGRIPEELGVIVGVRVHHSGCHHESGGIELAPGRAHGAYFGDPAMLDADVGHPGRPPRAIDHRAGSDDVVEHGTSDVFDVVPDALSV